MDQEINISKPLIFSESVRESFSPNALNCNYVAGFSEQDVTWRMNTNNDFQFSLAQNSQSKWLLGGGVSFRNQYFDTALRDKLGTGFTKAITDSGVRNLILSPQNEPQLYTLGSSKITNIIRICPKSIAGELDINPFSKDVAKKVACKGAFYSAAFLLQRTLADDQDISPEEIELAAIIEEPLNDGTSRSSGRIVLADELPNGSGFVKHLYNHIDEYIRKCTNPNPSDKYTFSFINERHFKECSTASYDDLKTYRNLNYHGILDLRLAISILRIFKDSKFLVGLDDCWEHIEISDWRDTSLKLTETFVDSINEGVVSVVYGIPRIKFDDFDVLIVHPFWNIREGGDPAKNILTKAIGDTGKFEDIYFLDTFNLLRRPGWCYRNLINWNHDR